MKKLTCIFLTAALLAVLAGCTPPPEPKNGWETTDQGTFYYREDIPLEGWQDIDGNRYHFAEGGAMTTGWLDVGGSRYYLGTDGIPQTGWITVSGMSYRMGPDGAMITGWTDRDGIPCYLRADGTPATGWLDDGSERYYLDEKGTPVTGWSEIGGKHFYFQENGAMLSGWAQLEGRRYYFGADGSMITGLMNIDGKGYYFDTDGSLYSGWLTIEDKTYHFDADGIMAVGPREIDGATHYFNPHGVEVLLVNPWNYLPEGYDPELVKVETYYQMEVSAAAALDRLMADCRAAGHKPLLVSGYRTQADQILLYQRKVDYYLSLGWPEGYARTEAAKSLAIPGTSEHQLGLAADIIDSYYTQLDDAQADTATQQWLMEHCHEYGFILRYPNGTTDITGILFEPWHYRYVGEEMAREITDLGITLEEYLGAVVTEK